MVARSALSTAPHGYSILSSYMSPTCHRDSLLIVLAVTAGATDATVFQRFGLIAVDRSTQRRTVRPSGWHLGRLARAAG
jgi:hypothetical protein